MRAWTLVFLLGLVVLIAASARGMSSGDLYDICSDAYSSFSAGDSRTPEQKTNERRCHDFVDQALKNAGFIFVSESEDPVIAKLRESCPRLWVSPMAGPWVTYVHYWDQNGMTWWQRLMPADWSVSTAFNSLYPNCPNAREKAGVPKGEYR
jgi:hypothetical protein